METNHVYFEMNDYYVGITSPNIQYLRDLLFSNENFYRKLRDHVWIAENKLIVVESRTPKILYDNVVTNTSNYCISAPIKWVYEHCPELLNTENEKFVATPVYDSDKLYGRYGCPFIRYDENKIGYYYAEKINGAYQIVD